MQEPIDGMNSFLSSQAAWWGGKSPDHSQAELEFPYLVELCASGKLLLSLLPEEW